MTLDRARYKLIMPDDWEYPLPTCMDCGNECDTWEQVDIGHGGPYELWGYCPDCNVETFHARRRVGDPTNTVAEGG